MRLNTIYTIEEYVKQGFTETEAYAAKIHDKLVNKWICNNQHLSERDSEKLYAIQKRLGI